MRPKTMLLMVFPLLLSAVRPGAPAASPTQPSSGGYHIVFSQHPLAAGETVLLRLSPPVPAGTLVVWWANTSSGGRMDFGTEGSSTLYHAPWVILPGTPPVTVTAGFPNQHPPSLAGPAPATPISASIELQPSSVPGVDDCLGPGQCFSKVIGQIDCSLQTDVLPELVHRVEPVYPRSDFVRGVEETVWVQALICRSGRVIHVAPASPTQRDPKLIEAALAAVRQYVFKPATAAGEPVAASVGVPVIFRP